MHRAAYAEIDLAALRHNLRQVRWFAGESKVMCVIKANAYGHGLLQVAEALSQSDGFAVACVDEAIALRNRGITQTITVFQGFLDQSELAACAEHSLWPVLHDQTQLLILEQAAITKPLRVWLKLSSGMNRLGFAAQQAQELWRQLQAIDGIEQIGLMTHMASADEGKGDVDVTTTQIQSFQQHTATLEAERSLANSATLIAWPEARADWVRPGIMLYGASPFIPDIEDGETLQLRPVMRLASCLISIHQRRQDDLVGYGGIWHCPEDMPVGVVAICYGDGYPRHVDDTATVLVNGSYAPIIGRVSMDLLTVDLRGIEAQVGDEVTLWGEGLPVDEIAASADTIAYELLCGVYGRVEYRYRE